MCLLYRVGLNSYKQDPSHKLMHELSRQHLQVLDQAGVVLRRYQVLDDRLESLADLLIRSDRTPDVNHIVFRRDKEQLWGNSVPNFTLWVIFGEGLSEENVAGSNYLVMDRSCNEERENFNEPGNVDSVLF